MLAGIELVLQALFQLRWPFYVSVAFFSCATTHGVLDHGFSTMTAGAHLGGDDCVHIQLFQHFSPCLQCLLSAAEWFAVFMGLALPRTCTALLAWRMAKYFGLLVPVLWFSTTACFGAEHEVPSKILCLLRPGMGADTAINFRVLLALFVSRGGRFIRLGHTFLFKN